MTKTAKVLRGTRAVFAASILAAALVAANATAADSYHVRLVRCGSFAEDSTAHVSQTRYAVNDGTARITYRCDRKGY